MKYLSIISVPLFSFISLLLILSSARFNYSELTFSRSVYLFTSSWQRIIFRFNFVVKAILDLGFIFYALNVLKIPLHSLTAWLWITSIILFGFIGVFLEDKSRIKHYIVVYGFALCYSLSEIAIAVHLHNNIFITLTLIGVIIQLGITVIYGLLRKTNTIVQIACMLLVYMWVIMLVHEFL